MANSMRIDIYSNTIVNLKDLLVSFRTIYEIFIQNFVINAHNKILNTSKIEFYKNYFADW
tara:strand:- start:30 stop:209 length:180 start_codon:yes stop_codon:yes gene_type:complete